MGDDERCIYEPYIRSGGEWAHVGKGTISEAMDIGAGEAIGELVRSYEATFKILDDCARQLAALAFRTARKHSKSRRKAVSRSRRNSMTVKRCAHGRAQRTRRCRR